MHDNIVKMLMKCNVWWFDIIWTQSQPKIFSTTSTIWKIPNIFQKPQILGQKIWKSMIKEWKKVIPKREADLETENWVGKWIWVKERSLGSWEVRYCQERSRRSEQNSQESYI